MIEDRGIKYIVIIGGMLLAALSMSLYTCAYNQSIPIRRMAYCIDHGYSYTWDRTTDYVTCTK